MRKLLSLLLALALFCSVVPAAFADSLVLAPAAKDSVEFYTIGNSVHTFAGLYDRMHIYLDLNKYPIPEPQKSDYTYPTGAHDEFYVLRDDDYSYDYIGYVCGPEGYHIFIIWSWSGYHKDGSLIGVDSFYTTDGVYLGCVQRNYTTGAAVSSAGCPFWYGVGSVAGME